MRRFLIDTDTASDDAVALVMALRSPEVQVEAITVVAGNVSLEQAMQNALYTTELCGQLAQVPVYAGLAKPLLRELVMAREVHGQDGMGDMGLDLTGRQPADGHAVDVLIDVICSNPGEITLVTLGPLSNVAVALLKEPQLAQAVKQCVVMGGAYRLPGNITPLAEFNIYVDPEAAKVVFESGMALRLVGWEESVQAGFVAETDSAALRDIGTKFSDFAVGIQGGVNEHMVKYTGVKGFSLPDPLAMAVALEPNIASFAERRVDVVVGDGPARGQTVVDTWGVTGRPANAEVAENIAPEEFLRVLGDLLR